MKIAIGSDHVGVELKQEIIEFIQSLGHEIEDLGPFSNERIDYPAYGKLVAEKVSEEKYDYGILICGTGVGISISANKVKGIRAVVCSEPYSAQMSKRHNNTNILAFGARVVGSEMAKMIVKEWLDASFDGDRHTKRIQMISDIEDNNNC